MRNIKHIIWLTVMILGASASAAVIVSESFSTGNTADDYRTGVVFSGAGNSNVMTGTVGFRYDTTTTYNWVNGSSALTPLSTRSLTHSLVQGSPAAGALKLTTVNASGVARVSRRQLDTTPTGSSFYMSGLVNMNGSLANLANNELAAMGLGVNVSNTNIDMTVGLYFGLSSDSNGDDYLAAFAGGNTYLLGNKLTAAQASETQMIVLKIDYNTSGDNDTLTAWIAQQGETNLTQMLSVSNFNAGTAASLYRFLIQTKNGADTTASTVYLDEFRLGTTLQDVTSIPIIGLLTVNNGTGSGSYTNGEQIAIAANAPASGRVFDQWIGDTQYVDNVTYTNALVTMSTNPVTLTAIYKDTRLVLASIIYTTFGFESPTYTNGTVAGKTVSGIGWVEWDAPTAVNNATPLLTQVQTNVVFSGSQALALGDISNRVLVRTMRTVTNTLSYWDACYKSEATNNFGTSAIMLRGVGANQQFKLDGANSGWFNSSRYATYELANAAGEAVSTVLGNWDRITIGIDLNTGTYSFYRNATWAFSGSLISNMTSITSWEVDITPNQAARLPVGQYAFYVDDLQVGAAINGLLTVNNGTGSGSYTNGEQVAIAATVISGKTFVAWTGDTVYLADSNSANTTVTMPAQAISLTATYVDTTYALTVTSGTGGGTYTNGTQVAIDATAIGGKTFVAWTGDTVYLADSNSASTTVTMPSQAVNLTAMYVDTTYALTVTSGNNSGSYTNGQQVAVAADAPAPGMAFNQWTGDTVYLADSNSANTTVTMPAQAVNLTATYKDAAPQSTTNGTPYSWLDQYGLTNHVADDVLDQDNDGLLTWQEYIAGTDPTNAVSCLKAAQAARNVVTWTAQSNRIYSVYWSTNLVKGFTALDANIPYPRNSYTNTNPDSRVNHYQIKVQLP